MVGAGVLVGGGATVAGDEDAAINQAAIAAMSRRIQLRSVLLDNLNPKFPQQLGRTALALANQRACRRWPQVWGA